MKLKFNTEIKNNAGLNAMELAIDIEQHTTPCIARVIFIFKLNIQRAQPWPQFILSERNEKSAHGFMRSCHSNGFQLLHLQFINHWSSSIILIHSAFLYCMIFAFSTGDEMSLLVLSLSFEWDWRSDWNIMIYYYLIEYLIIKIESEVFQSNISYLPRSFMKNDFEFQQWFL